MVEGRYSLQALKRLNPRLNDLMDLNYTTEELLYEVAARSYKLSIQGVQPKLSARLNVKEQSFELVDRQGQYILKPPSAHYPNLPENEDCTMKLAKTVGLEVPLHGLIYAKDGQLTYWIRRFDRTGLNKKLSVEDFAQLASASRKTKYKSSLEQVARLVEDHCTFPRVESRKLLKLLLFCFLCGNEDQHLKNFSILIRDSKVQLSPCYDQVNSTIALANAQEESALPMAGKKRKLKRSEFLEYARTRLKLADTIILEVFQEIAEGLVHWDSLIRSSFLPKAAKDKYLQLWDARRQRLAFTLAELDDESLELLSRESQSRGPGGHRAFFRQLERQRAGCLQCLTEEQLTVAFERQKESGGWQAAYTRVAALCRQAVRLPAK
jgi:serine/threonine-protein kinase HipA